MKITLKIEFSQEKIACGNEKSIWIDCNPSGYLPVQNQQ